MEDALTGSAVVATVIGSNVGRDINPATRQVQLCKTVGNKERPELRDASRDFRGQEQHMHVITPPRVQSGPPALQGKPLHLVIPINMKIKSCHTN